MKNPFSKITIPAPRPRTWLGVGLIGISIVGTVIVVADSKTGTGIVLAATFIPAGHEITADDIVSARLMTAGTSSSLSERDVIGRRVVSDLAPGDLLTQRSLDGTFESRKVVSVPVGITPAVAAIVGARVELWFVAKQQQPPELIAHDATVIASRRGSFGDGDMVDLSIDSRDVDKVIGSLGADGLFTMTVGNGGS